MKRRVASLLMLAALIVLGGFLVFVGNATAYYQFESRTVDLRRAAASLGYEQDRTDAIVRAFVQASGGPWSTSYLNWFLGLVLAAFVAGIFFRSPQRRD